MLAFTPSGRLAYVTAQSNGVAQVIVLETLTSESVPAQDLRPLRAAA